MPWRSAHRISCQTPEHPEIPFLLLWLGGVGLTLHILLILFTGGYALGSEPLGPLMVLLTLVTGGLLWRRREFSVVPAGLDAAILGLTVLIVYLAPGKGTESGDTLPNRYLPLSILTQGTFYLDRFPELVSESSRFYEPDDLDRAYFLRFQKGHYVSAYSEAPALLALPFFLPSALGGVPSSSPLLGTLEKLASAVIVALSVAFLYLALRRVASQPMALFASLAYALGSSNLSVCSQGLWQHGASQLALTAAIYCLVRGRSEPNWIGRSGLPLALAVVSRPLDGVLVLPLGIYVLLYHREQFWRCVLWGIPLILWQLAYNAWYLGGPLEFPLGEVAKKKIYPSRGGFYDPVMVGLGRLFVSPARGLWVYSPVFFWSLPGLVLAWRRDGDRLLRWMGISTLLLLGIASKWMGWWGGHTFGPRLLSDLSPLLAFALYPLEGWLRSRRFGQGLVGLCLAWSVAAHSLGAFTVDTWSADMDVNFQPEALYSWSNNQLVNTPRRWLSDLWVARELRPTSRTDDDKLDRTRTQARYWGGVWPKRPLQPGQRLTLALRVKNESRAIWLTGGELHGRARLAWRWFRGGRQVGAEGRLNLGRNLFPGDTYDVRISFRPPREPGLYGLEVGMINEGISWYPGPMRFLVTVEETTVDSR